MGTATNPFVELLADFRAAAASLDTRHFGVTAWWYFPKRFTNPKRRVLGICCLPVRYEDEVHFQEFRLTVSVAGNHAKCGPVFCDLASRAGAALPPPIREQLADYVPIYVSETAPWWFAFLWRVFVGTKPLEHPRSADTDELVETPIPLPLPRPLLLSIDAIERCKLHTDQPVFPPPDDKTEQAETTPQTGKGQSRKGIGEQDDETADDNGQPPVANPVGDASAAVRLLSIYTNGLADERLEKARSVLDSDLTVDDKLWKIDELMPIPPAVSGEKLGKALGVSKAAVQNTTWYEQKRKGRKDEKIAQRGDRLRQRGKTYERDH